MSRANEVRTSPRPRASTHGLRAVVRSLGLRGFRAFADPPVPALPSSEPEWYGGGRRFESVRGLHKRPANGLFLLEHPPRSILTFILLARAFRSLLLPLKAVLLNLLSVAAAWGLIVLVYQKGVGSEAIWSIEATQAINVELPVVIFAFLFGISMDYQVFIISRMREAYDRTGSTETAVVEGIGRTGRLVRSAALILFLAFVAFALQPGTEAKIFATALGAGILIDATIIRGVLAPAVVALFGRWNWWLPDWAARILRVEPSPLEHDVTPEVPAPAPAG
jgi:RND superfamily putative drug exporter